MHRNSNQTPPPVHVRPEDKRSRLARALWRFLASRRSQPAPQPAARPAPGDDLEWRLRVMS